MFLGMKANAAKGLRQVYCGEERIALCKLAALQHPCLGKSEGAL